MLWKIIGFRPDYRSSDLQKNQIFPFSIFLSLFVIFLCFLFSGGVPPDGSKREIQFCGLFVAYLILVGSFFSSHYHFERCIQMCRGVRGFVSVWLIAIFWLLLMLFMHGDGSDNLHGVNSGLLGLMVLPVAAYAGVEFSLMDYKIRRQFILVASSVALSFLAFENVCLVLHKTVGLSVNSVYRYAPEFTRMPGLDWEIVPRLAMNVREGNILSILCLLLIYSLIGFFLFDRRFTVGESLAAALKIDPVLRSMVFSMAFMIFFNAFFTRGRALLCAVFVPLLFSLAWSYWRDARPLRFMTNQVIKLLIPPFVMAFLLNSFVHLMLGTWGLQAHVTSYLSRADANRFDIWQGYFVHGFLKSPLIGNGFNHIPAFPPPLGPWTPHNFILRILSDSGMLGGVIFLLLLIVGSRFYRTLIAQKEFCLWSLSSVVVFCLFSGFTGSPFGVLSFVVAVFVLTAFLSSIQESEIFDSLSSLKFKSAVRFSAGMTFIALGWSFFSYYF